MGNFLVGTLLFAMALMVLPLPALSILLRGVIVLCLVPVLIHARSGFRKPEMTWMFLVATYLFGTLLSSLCAEDLQEGMLDFARQLFVCTMSVVLIVYLRSASARKTAVVLLAVLNLLSMLTVFYFAVRNPAVFTFGLSGFKAFKNLVAQEENLPLNAISSCLIVTGVIASCLFKRKSFLLPGFLLVVSTATFLCGSVTTILCFGFGVTTYIFFRRGWLKPWLASVVGVGTTGGIVASNYLTGYVLNEITVGRFSLWQAAVKKFAERPLVGWGAQSWKVDLATFLPNYDSSRFDTLLELQTGGFHNAYLGLLADKGLVTFLPGLLMLLYLVRWSLLLYRRRQSCPPIDLKLLERLPIVMMMLPVQYMAEESGLFGFANGIADFLAFCVAALVVALAAEYGPQVEQQAALAESSPGALPEAVHSSSGSRFLPIR